MKQPSLGGDCIQCEAMCASEGTVVAVSLSKWVV